jgi:hypothetical protein
MTWVQLSVYPIANFSHMEMKHSLGKCHSQHFIVSFYLVKVTKTSIKGVKEQQQQDQQLFSGLGPTVHVTMYFFYLSSL